jgi:hypothetical protein
LYRRIVLREPQDQRGTRTLRREKGSRPGEHVCIWGVPLEWRRWLTPTGHQLGVERDAEKRDPCGPAALVTRVIIRRCGASPDRRCAGLPCYRRLGKAFKSSGSSPNDCAIFGRQLASGMTTVSTSHRCAHAPRRRAGSQRDRRNGFVPGRSRARGFFAQASVPNPRLGGLGQVCRARLRPRCVGRTLTPQRLMR